jgi:hypothetical protein
MSMQITDITKIIGEILSGNQKIKSVVLEATGEDPYLIWTSETHPRARQIAEILEGAEKEGKDIWFLTRVLMEPMSDIELRAIWEAYPKTLQSLPTLESQVLHVLELLQRFLSLLPRAANINLAKLSEQSTRLLAFKSLHESLHVLQLRLTYGVLPESDISEFAAVDLESCRKRIIEACDQAADAAALLGKGSPDEKSELAWIDRLREVARQGQPAPDASGSAAEALRPNVLRLIRPQLGRLNREVLTAARAFLGNLPRDTEAQIRKDLSFAIRNLKPTVLARALKQKLWQDVENDFAVFAATFAEPQRDLPQFTEEWLRLKDQILWLVQLDPHLKWAEDARKYSDEISDQLAKENFKPSLDTYRKLTSLCFFAIDAMLKADCSSLREVGRALQPGSFQAAPSRNLH